MSENNIKLGVYFLFSTLFFLYAFIQEKTLLYLVYFLFFIISVWIASDSFQKAFDQILEKLDKKDK